MTAIVALSNEKHKQLKVDATRALEHTKGHHLTYLSVNEFTLACAHFPIAFIRDPETQEFNSIAILGLEQGENLFLRDNKWQAGYIPANIRRHPFFMSPKNDEKTEWSVCIDESSEMLSQDNGQSLFDENGEPTQFTEEVQKFLTTFIESESLTLAFAKFLDSKGLLRQTSITLKSGEETASTAINGIYIVDEEKLDNLIDSDYLELHKKGCLKPIYAHLSSLNKIQSLTELKQA